MKQENAKTNGKVFLVGAGPGDVGLITVRGRDLLSQAEVVVYDYLASRRLLAVVPAGAELIYVGKQAGRHSLSQDKINHLLVDKALQGKRVVRLKGGDPYVFGRGGEEALELAKAGIAFEVVPGVTAAVAAAAYAGIPVTHRDLASDFALITGHEDAQRTGESQIDWPSLGKWKGTLAFYMGVKNLRLNCDRLMENGMSPERSAAVIEWGTTTRQQTVMGTVGTIAEVAEAAAIKAPAIVLIGEVVKLREQLQWFEKRPLFGKRIVVTRARAQASELAERLEQLGAEVLECPTIRVEQPDDVAALEKAAAQVGQFDWLILTSVNGVDAFFDALLVAGFDARQLGGVKVCTIGPATAARLHGYGVVADLLPGRFVAESILEAFAEMEQVKGKRILLARADIARSDLPEGLRELGAEVSEVTAYRTVADESGQEEFLEALEADKVDWITFTSSSTVRNFLGMIDLGKLSGKKFRVGSIGPVTSAIIKKSGLRLDVEAAEYTIGGLVEAIVSTSND
ncbi:MAG: uroporphyrinogen-III C-methyltransferase [Sedimentisphaerales bacterium]|nr:uroporphyrinogen-III C-methyltransferase [Sedimentisphaerales bacterium]